MEQLARDGGNLEFLCHAGDDYYKARNYVDAKRVYKEVMDRPDVSASVKASSMYGLALCYWETGLKNAARRLMEQISNGYPETDGARKAKWSLFQWDQGGK